MADVQVADSLTGCATGFPIPIAGGHLITVLFRGADAHDEGRSTIDSTYVAGPGNSIIECRQSCDFEGVVEWGIGTRGSNAFQVTALTNPARLVIDVKHE